MVIPVGELDNKKKELLKRLAVETRSGLEWDRYFPNSYSTEWQGRQVTIENLQDEPRTLRVAEMTHVPTALLRNGAMVEITARDTPEIARLLRQLLVVIETKYLRSSLAMGNTVVRESLSGSEVADIEAAELDRLLAV